MRVTGNHLDPMAMANTSPFLSTFKHQSSIFSPNGIPKRRNKNLSLHASSQSTQNLSLNLDYLKREFGGPGISFHPIGAGHGCSIRLRLENKSVANVTMPGGMITSYRPMMWHGGLEEVLHTAVSGSDGGATKLQGGVAVDFRCVSEGSNVWVPRDWMLREVKGTPDKSLQIEFFCTSPLDGSEAQYAVTLSPDQISSELSIRNNGLSPLHIKGCILNHLKASTPDATYLIGLQWSDYFTSGPIMSDFTIIPPDASKKGAVFPENGPNGLFGKIMDELGGEEKEEPSNYLHLTDESSRFYRNEPREFTVLDRGRRNSVKIGKNGFDRLYTMSPGSRYDYYGRYAYVCVGPVLLEPVVVHPGDVWLGSQYLSNPNL